MEVKMEWFEKLGMQYGRFHFVQKLTKKAAENAINEWKIKFTEQSTKKITMIWDCTELTDYEPMARIFWQKTLKETQNQIECVWLISDSKIIRAGASIMSLFVNFNMKVMSSEKDVFATNDSSLNGEMVMS